MWVGIVLGLVGLLLGVLLVLPVGGADVPIVISLLNAFTGLTVAAGGYVLDNTRAAGRRHPGRRLRYVPHPADGPRDGPLGGQHPVRRAQGRLDARRRRGLRPAGESAGPEDVAILLGVRRPGDHRARLRPRGRPGPAHAARARRRAQRAGHAGRLRDPPGRRPDARAHERAARRGPGALRAAQGDGRHQRRVQARRRRARRRRQRRRQPGRARPRPAPRSTACRSSTPTRPSRSSS